MICIEEIPLSRIDEFWAIHFPYLINDGIIEDEEDKAYFSGPEYRDVIAAHMAREQDRHHMVYFVEAGIRVGAAQYCTYKSEDGKCFILDFWVFPEFRGGGMGHRCFAAFEGYAKADGAAYYELNVSKENSARFWASLGFRDSGVDEWGMRLMVKL